MKVVINRGANIENMGLSVEAVQLWCECKNIQATPHSLSSKFGRTVTQWWKENPDEVRGRVAPPKNNPLSDALLKALQEARLDMHDVARDDCDLIGVVETLGPRASAPDADVVVVEIPDDVEWMVQSHYEHGGREWVAEKHRTWGKPE